MGKSFDANDLNFAPGNGDEAAGNATALTLLEDTFPNPPTVKVADKPVESAPVTHQMKSRRASSLNNVK